MVKFTPIGPAGGPPVRSSRRQAEPGQSGFDALLCTVRGQAAAAAVRTPGREDRTDREDPGLAARRRLGYEHLTDDAIRVRVSEKYEDGTLAGRCRAALELAEVGIDEAAGYSELRQAFSELVKATETSHGRLPHDDLQRIMAMYDCAQKLKQEDL